MTDAKWDDTIIPGTEKFLSNKDFDTSRFKPHGSALVWPHDNIVRFDVTGPFNLEFSESISILNSKVYAEVANTGPFVAIAIFRNSMLMPTEAVTRFADSYREWKGNGFAPIASAWVVESDVEGAFIMLPIFEKKFQEIGLKFKYFDNAKEAEAWVTAQLGEICRE
jgi:hypothetical protein